MFPVFVTRQRDDHGKKFASQASRGSSIHYFHFLCLSNFAASTTCTFIPHKPLKASLIVVQPQLIQSAPNLHRVQLLCSSSMLNGGTSVLLICIMSTSSGLLLIHIISAYWWCAARGVPCPKPAGRGPREQRKWGGIDGRFLHRSLCSQVSWQQLPGAFCWPLRERDKRLGETETVGDSCCWVAPKVKVAADGGAESLKTATVRLHLRFVPVKTWSSGSNCQLLDRNCRNR